MQTEQNLVKAVKIRVAEVLPSLLDYLDDVIRYGGYSTISVRIIYCMHRVSRMHG